VLRILLIGDIVGKPGLKLVQKALPALRKREQLDFVIANGENAADGSGITPGIYKKLIEAGVDCVTLGDHIYRRNEIAETLRTESNILKPANYPEQAPGKGWTVLLAASGVRVAVISLMGRVFMRPVDCPFNAAEKILKELPADVRVRIVDFHAEATSDKQVMGRLLDGRVSAVLGTHTHVTTADEQIFPGGMAFQCDVGMTGPHESILGRRIDRVVETTISFQPTHFDVATDDVRLNGTIVEVDETTGKATAIRRLSVTDQEGQQLADAHTAEQQAAKKGPIVL
jgi:metallophosphoesterase (TIGR00282 family)